MGAFFLSFDPPFMVSVDQGLDAFLIQVTLRFPLQEAQGFFGAYGLAVWAL